MQRLRALLPMTAREVKSQLSEKTPLPLRLCATSVKIKSHAKAQRREGRG
jgi:hypothetical protein